MVAEYRAISTNITNSITTPNTNIRIPLITPCPSTPVITPTMIAAAIPSTRKIRKPMMPYHSMARKLRNTAVKLSTMAANALRCPKNTKGTWNQIAAM